MESTCKDRATAHYQSMQRSARCSFCCVLAVSGWQRTSRYYGTPGRSAADAEVASPYSHSANPELQKLIDGNRASAGRSEIEQHQCVHHFRLVKPIVETIRPVNRFVARNHRWRVRQEGYRRDDQKAKGG